MTLDLCISIGVFVIALAYAIVMDRRMAAADRRRRAQGFNATTKGTR